MGKVTRKRYGAEFKAKVALEAIKGELTLAVLSASTAFIRRFPAPIYATLIEADEPGTFNLIWSRRNGD